jgi:hypothetical protein
MELEKKLNSFNAQLNALKDQSVLKKSKEQRREIYLEKKRREAELRKKEEEDKQKMLNKDS